MISKSLRRIVQTAKSSRMRNAVIFAALVLVLLIGVAQASGPMGKPRPPHHGGMWGKMPKWGHWMPWMPAEPVPTIKIVAVFEDYIVIFETDNFPEDQNFTVTMGEMYTRGIGGIEIGTFNSGDGSPQFIGAFIPADLYGRDRISIRASTDHQYPYYAFNWFWNNTAIAPEYTTLQNLAVDDVVGALESTAGEGLFELDSLETPLSEAVTIEEPVAEEAPAAEEAPVAEETTEEAAEETTEEAAEETTEEAAEEAETTEGVGGAEEAEEAAVGAELTGVTWQWIRFSDPVQGELAIDLPEQYTVEFTPEGLVAVKADCNNGSGTYIADETGGLDIAIGIVTAAACPPESLSDQFLQYLGDVVIYSFDGDELILDLPVDAGTLVFAAAEMAEAPAEEAAEAPAAAEAETTEEAAEETTEEAAEETPGSIVDIASADENFETLVAAVTAAGLADTLGGEGEFTVFAPTDDAFAALPEGTLESLLEDPEGALTDILLYHVVDGAVPAEVVVTLESATTLLGEPVAISVVDDGVVLNDAVNVLITDVMADNGIIHVIDGVLLPPSMSEAPAEEAEETTEEAAEETTEEAAEETTEEAAEETTEEAAEAEEAATVSGTVTYLQRIALPDDAVVTVQIYNASLADASEVVGEQVIETAGQQVPIPFEVAYNPEDINENMMYSVSARIEDSEGNLLFISDTAVPVITNDSPTEGVEIMTIQVAAAPEAETTEETEAEATEETEAEATEETEAVDEAPSLTGVVWTWVEFSDPVQGTLPIENPEQYTAEFMEDGTVGVKLDCNNGSGSFVADEAGGIDITIGAVTLALCQEDSLGDQFQQYLDAAEIYFFDEGDLYLDLPADSGTLHFTAAAAEEAGATAKLASITMTPLLQDENGEDEESDVPSFTICAVVRGETVTVEGENFPADQTFTVKMGVPQMVKPMHPKPMWPMEKPAKPMPMGPMKPDMSMPMGPPKGHPSDMWMKPQPKIWIPYYEADTLETGEGGAIEATFDIPAELAGAYKISILMITDHQFPYLSYNWFYNNDAEGFCDNDTNG